MSRPEHHRVASTNLGTSAAARPLEGKLAIVTGASRGIGAAIAHNLASKGCSIVLNYTSASSTSKTTALASTLETNYGIQTLIAQADMGDPTGPAHIVNLAKNHFSHPKTGKFQIDIIINNAGVARIETLEDSKIETFTWMYAINVLGPILLLQAALPYLPHDRSGRIVNLSSVSSAIGALGQSVYGGTKAALESMTRTWARELAERATVNAVNPGPVKTDMYANNYGMPFEQEMKSLQLCTPLARARPGVDDEATVKYAEVYGGREAYPHEIAGVVAMLCTADAGWCTGSVVSANGGMRFSF